MKSNYQNIQSTKKFTVKTPIKVANTVTTKQSLDSTRSPQGQQQNINADKVQEKENTPLSANIEMREEGQGLQPENTNPALHKIIEDIYNTMNLLHDVQAALVLHTNAFQEKITALVEIMALGQSETQTTNNISNESESELEKVNEENMKEANARAQQQKALDAVRKEMIATAELQKKLHELEGKRENRQLDKDIDKMTSINAELFSEISQQKDDISHLTNEIAELENELNRDVINKQSPNSNKGKNKIETQGIKHETVNNEGRIIKESNNSQKNKLKETKSTHLTSETNPPSKQNINPLTTPIPKIVPKPKNNPGSAESEKEKQLKLLQSQNSFNDKSPIKSQNQTKNEISPQQKDNQNKNKNVDLTKSKAASKIVIRPQTAASQIVSLKIKASPQIKKQEIKEDSEDDSEESDEETDEQNYEQKKELDKKSEIISPRPKFGIQSKVPPVSAPSHSVSDEKESGAKQKQIIIQRPVSATSNQLQGINRTQSQSHGGIRKTVQPIEKK
ncbi:MAG: hypothetical protein EZS28_009591 [Streblomastix strix]|uniref:Uncharacterized protein n=1 Tax=Streblomastix strix TaxID=222440 RepID=A0A5J4WKL1_9EUKA|nr:MAG: hypothetical protein EZS28_009591 [Streblomastix strix]